MQGDFPISGNQFSSLSHQSTQVHSHLVHYGHSPPPHHLAPRPHHQDSLPFHIRFYPPISSLPRPFHLLITFPIVLHRSPTGLTPASHFFLHLIYARCPDATIASLPQMFVSPLSSSVYTIHLWSLVSQLTTLYNRLIHKKGPLDGKSQL